MAGVARVGPRGGCGRCRLGSPGCTAHSDSHGGSQEACRHLLYVVQLTSVHLWCTGMHGGRTRLIYDNVPSYCALPIPTRPPAASIEEYRFQNALNLANQFLKKWKGTEEGDTALALKALALVKTDKAGNAGSIIDEVR